MVNLFARSAETRTLTSFRGRVLPVTSAGIGRARTLSASFEVFVDTGGLLPSCEKYSVAWAPRGVVHKEQGIVPPKWWISFLVRNFQSPISNKFYTSEAVPLLESSRLSRLVQEDMTSPLLSETFSDRSKIICVLFLAGEDDEDVCAAVELEALVGLLLFFCSISSCTES